VKAMRVPPGCQQNASMPAGSLVSATGSPPASDMRYSCGLAFSSRVLENARLVPSGLNRGDRSAYFERVNSTPCDGASPRLVVRSKRWMRLW